MLHINLTTVSSNSSLYFHKVNCAIVTAIDIQTNIFDKVSIFLPFLKIRLIFL